MAKAQKKNYVLDTNVLLLDPESIFSFDENNIYIPLVVIKELDSKKKERGSLGYSARQVVRSLNDLVKDDINLCQKGVKLRNGGTLFIVSPDKDFVTDFSIDNNDDEIAKTALWLKSKKKPNVVIVSRDLAFRLKCNALNIYTEDYRKIKAEKEFLEGGIAEHYVSHGVIDALYNDHDGHGLDDDDRLLVPNERAVFLSEMNPKQGALVYKCPLGVVRAVNTPKEVWGVTPRDAEQKLLMDALLDDDVKVVFIMGASGSGKTLLTLAAGLHRVIEGKQKDYHQLLVAKPIADMGDNALGFAPGSIDEKLSQWFGSVYDNLEHLSKYKKGNAGSKTWKDYQQMGYVDFLPLHSIRGRTIQNRFIFLDEAQNTSVHEITSIITRVGEGSKIIISGDPNQIDRPHLDSLSNGLVYAAEAFSNDEDGQKISCTIKLTKSKRSEVAKVAVRIL